MCDSQRGVIPKLSAELESVAETIAGHLMRNLTGSDYIFVLNYILARLEIEGIFVTAHELDLLRCDDRDIDSVLPCADPVTAVFLRRVWDYITGATEATRTKYGYDTALRTFLTSGEARLFAYGVTEARPKYWPVVAEYSIPYLAQKDWQLSGPANKMKEGQRNAREILRGLDATSARAAAEVLYFVNNPDCLGALP